MRPSTRPIALKRSSSAASKSSNSITYGSKNTFAAVRKSTPCFFRLACSLALSHSKSIANPDFEYTDIQYMIQGRPALQGRPLCHGVKENNFAKRTLTGHDVALWRRVARHGR